MNIKLKLTRAENLAHYGVVSGVVITLDLESEYLPCCVSSEVYESNSRTPMEAKKAQAIAARTYIAAHARSGTTIDDTANYQAFRWKDLATVPNCVAACQATTGQVLCYGGELITAWYSNSNGGRTKRSDEAWSAYKPWTVSQEDPWDVAGRAKWGEVKASHGVGMSQIGAAYAAFVGVLCRDILRFYYPGTEIVGDYGRGDVMLDKTNLGLVAHARSWIGNPYWYGTCCYKCTESLLASKTNQYPAHYTTSRVPRYRDDIAKGKSCADCVGLIKGYYWEKDGKVVYNAASDVSAGGMYTRATVKGVIDTLPEVPGLILHKSGHVGIYEGDGWVIEAKGFASGVVRSKLEATPWTSWLACPYISYAGFEDLLAEEPFKTPYEALVTTKTSPLNIWTDSKKTRSLLQIAKGDTLTVIGYGDAPGWWRVVKNGIAGYADGQYLTKILPSVDENAEDDAGDVDEDGELYTVTLPAVHADIKDAVLAIYPYALVSVVS